MKRSGYRMVVTLVVVLLGAMAPAGAASAAAGAYWVLFRDRGPSAPGAEEWLAAAERIAPDSWSNRQVAGRASAPDVRDLPLWKPYVDAVAALGTIRHETRWLNGVSVELTEASALAVRSLPCVQEVRPVAALVRQSLGPEFAPDGTPLGRTLLARGGTRGPYPYGPSYGQLAEIGVPPLHALGYTGNRVRMMMLDTGFRKDHQAFSTARILAERDFVFGDGNTQNEPEDDPGQQHHGTGTWATNGGYDPNHIVGPDYGAQFVLAKTEDIRSETQVEEDHYVAALEWADSLGVRVTSASLGYTCFDDGFCYDFPLKDGDTPIISRAIDIASARGILCVNSAGNYGYLGPMSLGTPADADSVLAIGAVDSLNSIAGFSSRGPSDDGRTKPEVVARGVATWWADASGVDTYGEANGTSLSCPLVSGAAVLVAEAHPEWSNMQIRAALINTADRHTTPDNDYGWGRINALAAVNSAPVLFPLPFDLMNPAPNAFLPNPALTFVWRRTHDGDSSNPIRYRVHLWQPIPGGPEWLLDAGADSMLTPGFALLPSTAYAWEVYADNLTSHRRISREVRTFHTSATTGVGDRDADVIRRLVVRVGPNPFSDAVRFAPVPAASAAPASAGEWSWSIYDPQGRRLSMAPRALSGDAEGVWDGTDGVHPVPSGVYYLEVTSGPRVARRVLVKLP